MIANGSIRFANTLRAPPSANAEVIHMPKEASRALVVMASLAVVAALFLLKTILMPIAFALVLSCMLAPITAFFRRQLRFGPLGPLSLFLLLVLCGLYLASLTAESLVRATYTLPSDIERLAGQVSGRISELARDQPHLRAFLPEPGTIDRLGDTNRALLIDKLSYGLTDFTAWVAHGFIILVLVIFLLIESDMLTDKVVRFFAKTPSQVKDTRKLLAQITRKIRAYLLARTVINAGLGVVIALALWALNIRFAITLGVFAALTNFVPYLGQLAGGALSTLVALGQTGSVGLALIVAAIYLAAVGIEGYVVTPLVMGRSLDLNGTTVLIACLFWGYLWGLVGLILAMPITVSVKVVCQTIPELNRWADLMSLEGLAASPLLAAQLASNRHRSADDAEPDSALTVAAANAGSLEPRS
jgi:predicted PurR-regulated permease PerM